MGCPMATNAAPTMVGAASRGFFSAMACSEESLGSVCFSSSPRACGVRSFAPCDISAEGGLFCESLARAPMHYVAWNQEILFVSWLTSVSWLPACIFHGGVPFMASEGFEGCTFSPEGSILSHAGQLADDIHGPSF